MRYQANTHPWKSDAVKSACGLHWITYLLLSRRTLNRSESGLQLVDAEWCGPHFQWHCWPNTDWSFWRPSQSYPAGSALQCRSSEAESVFPVINYQITRIALSRVHTSPKVQQSPFNATKRRPIYHSWIWSFILVDKNGKYVFYFVLFFRKPYLAYQCNSDAPKWPTSANITSINYFYLIVTVNTCHQVSVQTFRSFCVILLSNQPTNRHRRNHKVLHLKMTLT